MGNVSWNRSNISLEDARQALQNIGNGIKDIATKGVDKIQSGINGVRGAWPEFKTNALTKLSSIKNSMVEKFGSVKRSAVKRFNPDAGARMSMNHYAESVREGSATDDYNHNIAINEEISNFCNDPGLTTEEKARILKMAVPRIAVDLSTKKTDAKRLKENLPNLLNECKEIVVQGTTKQVANQQLDSKKTPPLSPSKQTVSTESKLQRPQEDSTGGNQVNNANQDIPTSSTKNSEVTNAPAEKTVQTGSQQVGNTLSSADGSASNSVGLEGSKQVAGTQPESIIKSSEFTKEQLEFINGLPENERKEWEDYYRTANIILDKLDELGVEKEGKETIMGLIHEFGQSEDYNLSKLQKFSEILSGGSGNEQIQSKAEALFAVQGDLQSSTLDDSNPAKVPSETPKDGATPQPSSQQMLPPSSQKNPVKGSASTSVGSNEGPKSTPSMGGDLLSDVQKGVTLKSAAERKMPEPVKQENGNIVGSALKNVMAKRRQDIAPEEEEDVDDEFEFDNEEQQSTQVGAETTGENSNINPQVTDQSKTVPSTNNSGTTNASSETPKTNIPQSSTPPPPPPAADGNASKSVGFNKGLKSIPSMGGDLLSDIRNGVQLKKPKQKIEMVPDPFDEGKGTVRKQNYDIGRLKDDLNILDKVADQKKLIGDILEAIKRSGNIDDDDNVASIVIELKNPEVDIEKVKKMGMDLIVPDNEEEDNWDD